MIDFAEQILQCFESGRISRREAAKRLAGLALFAIGVSNVASAEPPAESTFHATGLNHIGLRVADVARSRDFYQKQLGLSVIRDNAPGNCFMRAGDNYVGLFRSDTPQMDHYCYTVDNYEPGPAMEKLKQAGLSPWREENRVYFKDADGLTVQVAGKWDSWPGTPPQVRRE